ncbi:hypothetical protein R6Q57_013178, partial [Mikania cordata]
VGVTRKKKEVLGGAYIVQFHLEITFFSFKKKVTKAHSTITSKMGSKLNANCEPYIPTGSLEQVTTSSSP